MFFWGFLLGVLCTIALLKLLHEFSPDIWIFRWMTEKSLLIEEVEESDEPEEVELETINSPEINLGDSAENPRSPDDEVRENGKTSELQSKKERLLHAVASVHEGLSDSTSPETSQSSDEEIFQHPRPSKPPSEVDIQPHVRHGEPKTVPSNPSFTDLASPLLSLVQYNPTSLQVAPEVFSGWLKIRSKVVVGGQLVWHKRFFSLKADGWLSYYTTEKKRSDQLHGWINLHGCQVQCYVKEKSSTKKVFKILVKHSDNKIWHRHGPDPLIPPVPRKRNLSMRSRKCRLKAVDEATYLQWMIQLQTVVNKVTGTFTPSRVTSHETPSAGTERITESPPVGEPQISVTEYLPTTAAVSEPVVEMPPVVVPQPASTSALRVSVSLVGTQEASQPVVAVVSPAPIPTSSSTSQIVRRSREFAIADTVTEDTPDDRVFDADNRRGLLKELTKAATGLDLVHISLPVSLNEPFSFLQKMCEQIGYWELLDKADTCEDSCHRLLYTSAFVISQYCFDRTTKPFNPLLGETFEYVQEGKISFMSEQVSHHPPVGASYAFNSHFEYSQHQGVKTRFGGNSIPCEEIGMKHLKLKTHGDVFDWPGVKTVVHNVILGRLWIDHFGDLELVNKTTGDRAKIEFKECGWFSKGRWEVSGSIFDVDGKLRISFKGKRNEYITATVILGTELPENANPIWKHNKLQSEQNDPWKMSAFAQELNEVDGFLDQILPDTDSRFRPDRAALQKQDLKRAAAEKRLLEQKQRDQAKMRAMTGRTWTPRYFEKTEEQDHNFECWKFKGNYWEERDKRLAQFNRRSQSVVTS